MKCPSCAAEGPDAAAECAACGIIFAKWRAKEERKLLEPAPSPYGTPVIATAEEAAAHEFGLKLGLWLLVLLPILFFSGKSFLAHSAEKKRVANIQARFSVGLGRLTAFKPDLKDYKISRQGGASCAGGKLVILGYKSDALDDSHYQLPDEARAPDPDSATVAVWIDRGSSQRGQYTDGQPAFQEYARATVVHLEKGKVTYDPMEFWGPQPPMVKTHDDAASGPPPVYIIADRIAELCGYAPAPH